MQRLHEFFGGTALLDIRAADRKSGARAVHGNRKGDGTDEAPRDHFIQATPAPVHSKEGAGILAKAVGFLRH